MDDWHLIVVYGSPNPTTQRRLREHLQGKYEMMVGPWLVQGDFNTIIHQGEKMGGAGIHHQAALEFLQFLSMHNMIDMGFSDMPFMFG